MCKLNKMRKFKKNKMHCEVIITDYLFPRAELSVDQQQSLIRSTSKNVLNALIVSNLDFWLYMYFSKMKKKRRKKLVF